MYRSLACLDLIVEEETIEDVHEIKINGLLGSVSNWVLNQSCGSEVLPNFGSSSGKVF